MPFAGTDDMSRSHFETQDTIENARSKLVRKDLDMIVVNDVSDHRIGFNSNDNAVTVITADGDYVILHVHAVREPGARGNAIIDIFKLENGKVVDDGTVHVEFKIGYNPYLPGYGSRLGLALDARVRRSLSRG